MRLGEELPLGPSSHFPLWEVPEQRASRASYKMAASVPGFSGGGCGGGAAMRFTPHTTSSLCFCLEINNVLKKASFHGKIPTLKEKMRPHKPSWS